MTATTKTISNRKGATSTESQAQRSGMGTATHFLNSAEAGTIYTDIQGGCVAGATLTGPQRTRVAGDLVIEASSTAAGTVTLEDSPDGTTWTACGTFTVLASDSTGFRTTPQAAFYRVKFTAGAIGASKVEVFSQARP